MQFIILLGDLKLPAFSAEMLSLLDRGFIFAIAHIRGDATLGWSWYEDGKLLKKMNTFTDFVCCAEYLINEGYTTPDKLAMHGRSAGGLLIGAVVNMRPDLFKVAMADVPFVDVIGSMTDSTIPVFTILSLCTEIEYSGPLLNGKNGEILGKQMYFVICCLILRISTSKHNIILTCL